MSKFVTELKFALDDLEPLWLDLEDALLNDSPENCLDRAREFRRGINRLNDIAESLVDTLGLLKSQGDNT